MAYVNECLYCGNPTTGTCACIVKFGTELQKEMLDWFIAHPHRRLSRSIVAKVRSPIWKNYVAYLQEQKAYATKVNKGNKHGAEIQRKLQNSAEIEMEKINTRITNHAYSFDVLVTVKCTLRP